MKNQTNQPKLTDKIKNYQGTLKRLETVDLPRAMKRIGESGVGDWHENAEYEDAVNQKQLLEARISELKELINNLNTK